MNKQSNKAAIIGTTSWGTTLGLLLARKGLPTTLWARTAEEEATITRNKENKKHLPGFPFPHNLQTASSLEKALANARMVILAIPSQHIRYHAELINKHLTEHQFIVSVAKGLELNTAKRMTQVISEELNPDFHQNICVLSGPNIANEIARGLPATTVVASYNEQTAVEVQKLIATSLFRVYVNTDVIGVELGGTLKNVIALAAGMVDGLGYGDNTKAGLITRGLAEITRLGVAAGASPLTFAGLAGLGDLVVTCLSPLSRNRYVGQELAKGRSLSEIQSTMSGTAEGIITTAAVLKLSSELSVEMPIAAEVNKVLYGGLEVRQGVVELMERELKHEFAYLLNSAIKGL